MPVTISTHNGATVRQAHNLRIQSCVSKEKHIKPNGIHETWHHMPISKAYHHLFDEAVEEYNMRQKRPDRQIKNYLDVIRRDAKKHDCYEMIIGVYGNECTPDNSKIIMQLFVNDWHKRNPNLYMVGAYYHADEQGAPHVHIDYIPVAHGYKRGLKTQTGLVRALGEMGFEKHGHDTAQILWERRENKALENICNAFKLEVEHPQKSVKHMDTAEYKMHMDILADETLDNMKMDLDNADYQIQRLIEDYNDLQNDYNDLVDDWNEMQAIIDHSPDMWFAMLKSWEDAQDTGIAYDNKFDIQDLEYNDEPER